MIRYRYAFTIDNNVVDVQTLNRGDRYAQDSFTCIACKSPLLPHIGNKYQKHFTHYPGATCSEETYIHRLAKIIFYNRYTYCLTNKLPLSVKMDVVTTCATCRVATGKSCTFEQPPLVYDLTTEYDEIALEGNYGKFRADVLLRNTKIDDYIAIEMKVTHSVSREKIESGIKIIEFRVRSEADIELLKNKLSTMPFYDRSASFFNFERLQKTVHYTKYSCRKDYKYIFMGIYDDGRFEIQRRRLVDINEILMNNFHVLHHAIYANREFRLCFSDFLKGVRLKGLTVKSCILCVHSRIESQSFYKNEFDPTIWCNDLDCRRYPVQNVPNCDKFVLTNEA